MASDNGLNTNIYDINKYVNEIKKRFTPGVKDDTLMLGIFGYTGQVFSDMLQNNIVMASEFSNESIPSKAKFEKNIIAHALGMGISDIDAVPAQFDVLLTFIEDDILNWNSNEHGEYTFIFDKDTPIYIGDHCFHVDYDIRIKRIKLDGKDKYAYTAMYIMDVDNPISDITNPYLTPPVHMKVNGNNIIFTKCTLHQVTKSEAYKKILGDNSITAKTFTFTFSGQLAAFTIDVQEGTKKSVHLVPVYEGLDVHGSKYPYFYYTYLDSNTIRVKFDRKQYMPRINCDVTVNIQTTEGEGGNFTYNPDIYPVYSFDSEKYNYSNIGCELRPITGDSSFGANKKTIADLKSIIPKEALSRGSITNLADLENYFNMINTDDSKLYFYKKRDNALERLYYSFIVMRDAYNNIIPTNTIRLHITPDELQTERGSGVYVLKKGEVLKLTDDGYGLICRGDAGDTTGSNSEDGKGATKTCCNKDCENCPYCSHDSTLSEFKYIVPYNFVISKTPLYGIYLLPTIDAKKFLDFTYINEKCLYQYIATNIHVTRPYLLNSDTYTIDIAMEQNVYDDHSMIATDDEGNVKLKIKCAAVLYDDEDKPLRWMEAEFVKYEPSANVFFFRFNLRTEDYIDIKNRIRIEGDTLHDINRTNNSYAHFFGNTKCVIHILSIQDGEDGGWNGLEKILPESYFYDTYEEVIDEEGNKIINKDGQYKLSNSYTVVGGIDFFYDYSEIVSSTVTPVFDKDKNLLYYDVTGVPAVKFDYFDTEDKALFFCAELVKRKNYIDYAIQVLEDAFGMDFKFFNTYGPSALFTIPDYCSDPGYNYLNRTNLSIIFRMKLKPNYDTNIVNDIIHDIKGYIEDINDINSLHMPNLISFIMSKYGESLVFFEFVDVNGYGPGIQHIEAQKMPDEVITPEFLNIYTIKDVETGELKPDITILMS